MNISENKNFYVESLLVPGLDKKVYEESILVEKKGNETKLVLPATVLDVKNLNNRVYPTTVMEKAVNSKELKERMAKGYLIGSADDHPATPYVPPIRGSHLVIDAWVERINGASYLMNEWRILETANGRELRALIDGGASFGVSIRGFGVDHTPVAEYPSDKDAEVISEYEFLGTDCVGEPSAQLYAGVNVPHVRVVESIKQKSSQSINEDVNKMSKFNEELKVAEDDTASKIRNNIMSLSDANKMVVMDLINNHFSQSIPASIPGGTPSNKIENMAGFQQALNVMDTAALIELVRVANKSNLLSTESADTVDEKYALKSLIIEEDDKDKKDTNGDDDTDDKDKDSEKKDDEESGDDDKKEATNVTSVAPTGSFDNNLIGMKVKAVAGDNMGREGEILSVQSDKELRYALVRLDDGTEVNIPLGELDVGELETVREKVATLARSGDDVQAVKEIIAYEHDLNENEASLDKLEKQIGFLDALKTEYLSSAYKENEDDDYDDEDDVKESNYGSDRLLDSTSSINQHIVDARHLVEEVRHLCRPRGKGKYALNDLAEFVDTALDVIEESEELMESREDELYDCITEIKSLVGSKDIRSLSEATELVSDLIRDINDSLRESEEECRAQSRLITDVRRNVHHRVKKTEENHAAALEIISDLRSLIRKTEGVHTISSSTRNSSRITHVADSVLGKYPNLKIFEKELKQSESIEEVHARAKKYLGVNDNLVNRDSGSIQYNVNENHIPQSDVSRSPSSHEKYLRGNMR